MTTELRDVGYRFLLTSTRPRTAGEAVVGVPNSVRFCIGLRAKSRLTYLILVHVASSSLG